jgi:hypothetical protein
MIFDARDYIHFSKIKLWAGNPRSNDQAVPRLIELLRIHGQKSRIGVWRKNMTIYKGNTTFKALTQMLRLSMVGCNHTLAEQLTKGLIKVEWLDFPSETAAIAYAIADNKSSEFAEWDDEILRGLLNTPQMVKQAGFSDVEKRALFFEPEPAKLAKINAVNIGLKDKIIIVVLDAAKRDMFKQMLARWILSTGIKGVEVK